MRDIYGRLIDGSQGVIGTLRVGGDGPQELTSSGEPPTEKLVAFSGETMTSKWPLRSVASTTSNSTPGQT